MDRVVVASIEGDRDPVLLDLDGPPGRIEATVPLLGCRFLEAMQP